MKPAPVIVDRDVKPQNTNEGVSVRCVVEPVDDPDLLRWFDDWVQKLLNDTSTPEHRRRS